MNLTLFDTSWVIFSGVAAETSKPVLRMSSLTYGQILSCARFQRRIHLRAQR
jgi:hypothetical protein